MHVALTNPENLRADSWSSVLCLEADGKQHPRRSTVVGRSASGGMMGSAMLKSTGLGVDRVRAAYGPGRCTDVLPQPAGNILAMSSG
jgi:hypothetical protein